MHSIKYFIAILGALLAFNPSSAFATIFLWDGGGSNDFFATAANWNPDGAPPSSDPTNDLQFGGTVRLAPDSQGTTYSANSLTFNSGAGAFVVRGGTLVVGAGGITNNSTSQETINNDIFLSQDQTWTIASGAGALNLGGTFRVVANALTLGSGTVNMTGNFSVSGSRTLSSLILSGATLNTTNDFVVGNGTVNQTAGTVSVNKGKNLSLASNATEIASYNLSGTGAISVGQALIGNLGSADFVQTGGTFSSSSFYLGYGAGSNGTYKLSGGTLSGGSALISASSSTGVLNQSGGVFRFTTLTLGSGSAAAKGTYNLDGGYLQAGTINHAAGTGVLNFNGGILQAVTGNASFLQGLTTASVRDGGAIIDTNGLNVTVGQALTHSTISGDFQTDGGLTKQGSGTLSLGGVNTYTGGTTVNGGTLSVSSDANLGASSGAVTLQNGSNLVITSGFVTSRTFNLNSGVADFGGSDLVGALVNGGYVAGGAVLDHPTFNNVTTLPGSNLSINPSGAVLNNVTLRGNLNMAAPGTSVSFSNGLVTGSGTINLAGASQAPSTFNTSATEIQGTTTISSGATMANSGSVPLYLSAGSRTTINSGGTLSTTGSAIELNGSLLVNNGTQGGTLNVNYGSTAKGSGVFGTVNVNDGGRFAPGNSPGTATLTNLSLGSAGRFEFELNSARATAGNGADFINVLGQLAITATSSVHLTIAVISLNSANQAAPLTDFDARQSYTFTLASAAGGITGFASSNVTVDTTGFGNSLQGGHFEVAQDGNSLQLQFRPVPEPQGWTMMLCGAAVLASFLRWRASRGTRGSFAMPGRKRRMEGMGL